MDPNITNTPGDNSNSLLEEREYKTLEDFYPFYLSQHRNNLCRLLHLVGTSLATLIMIYGIFTLSLITMLLSLVYGYGFAWVGHFFIEKNKPATFKYPGMSLACDFIMAYHILTRQLHPKLTEFQIESVRQIPVDFI